MNKTSIEYCDLTWNPVTGCTKGCSYCYARRLAHGRLKTLYLSNPNVATGCDPDDPFAPRFWDNRLLDPLLRTKPARIFACDMGDLWDPHVPPDWIEEVLMVTKAAEEQTLLFLTKQPTRASIYDFPANAWVGVTIDSVHNDYWERLHGLSLINAPVRYISYEPLLSAVKRIPDFVDWIIIGAMTGPKAIEPKRWWVQELIAAADRQDIPVFLKNNLNWPEHRQEFPSPSH